MAFHSDMCNEHVRPIQKMIINDAVVCPSCELAKENKRLEEETQAYYNRIKSEEQFNTLANKSILDDNTLLAARFDTYITEEKEEFENKKVVLNCLERFKQGEIFNLILQGKQGTGKSHLAYSTIYELNQDRKRSCLFISVYAMLEKIKDSFNNKESKYTQEYFKNLLSDVDFLVLDDLGAETGAIDSEKTATDFVQRVLYGITNARQDKVTILTTNLDGKTLFNMYDKKLVSRLLKNPKYVIFKDSKDKRINSLPF